MPSLASWYQPGASCRLSDSSVGSKRSCAFAVATAAIAATAPRVLVRVRRSKAMVL
jgi:hypothetical protein